MKMLFTLLFPSHFLMFGKNWKGAWSQEFFRQKLILNSVFLLIIAAFIPQFFDYIQNTPGHIIDDPILNLFPAKNMSLYIFWLIYFVISLAIVNISTQPFLFLKLIQTYCLMTMIRLFCMYFIPLEPSASIIPLEDPFVGQLFYNNSVITKDLFFSGHVSTMSLLSFIIPFRSLKYLFAAATIFVAIFILIQHVHYTIDIIFAPVISWICYKLSK